MAKETQTRGDLERLDIVTTHTTTEKLVELIQSNKDFLVSDTVDQQLEEMRLTKELYIKYAARTKVVKRLKEDYGMSERKAWKLADLTPTLMSKVTRQLNQREFHVDILFHNIMETRRIAMADGDWKTVATCDRNYMQAIKDFTGSAQALKPEDLVLPDIELGFHPEWFKDVPPIESTEYKNLIRVLGTRKLQQRQRENQIIDTQYEETA